jgi:type III restriction enzyme
MTLKKNTNDSIEYLSIKSQYDILAPDERWSPDLRKGEAALFDSSDTRAMQPPLVNKLRELVYVWRKNGYDGASDTTKALLAHWFSAAHRLGHSEKTFQWYFGQREAVETVIYLVEACGLTMSKDLKQFSDTKLLDTELPEDWLRVVLKLATGAGKTKVMSLLIVWSYFHKLYEAGSTLSNNFLLIAPNIIVLDRLKDDFENNAIFRRDPLIPDPGYEGRDWDWQLTTHIGSDIGVHNTFGNLYLTNIQKIYTRVEDILQKVEDMFLGSVPVQTTTENMFKIRDVVRNLSDLIIINDEAHHIWDDKMAWSQVISDIDLAMRSYSSRLSLQLDLTATPKDPSGKIFPQVVSAFPLVEAMALDILKRPWVPDVSSIERLREDITKISVAEKYKDCIDLGVQEFKKQYTYHTAMGKKPVMFVMVPETKDCTSIINYLELDPMFSGKIFEIHTNAKGENADPKDKAKKKELDEMRKVANTMDSNNYLVIVSVLMLKEGWDVSNVTTVIGLRAYSSKGQILPEQALGRGLRKMVKGTRDREELFVVGNQNFMKFVQELVYEGVTIAQKSTLLNSEEEKIEVVEVKVKDSELVIPLDIEYPILGSKYTQNKRSWSDIHFDKLELKIAIYSEKELNDFTIQDILNEEDKRVIGNVGSIDPTSNAILRHYCLLILKSISGATTSEYDVLFEIVKNYVINKAFDTIVNINDKNIIKNLADTAVIRKIAEVFINGYNSLPFDLNTDLVAEKWIKMSDCPTTVFTTQKYVISNKCITEKMVGDSDFELRFAVDLDKYNDIISFGKNFASKISSRYQPLYFEYKKSDGTMANYYPDFLVKADSKNIYIIETKGREDEDDNLKFKRLEEWCVDANKAQSKYCYSCVKAMQTKYERVGSFKSFSELISYFIAPPPKTFTTN